MKTILGLDLGSNSIGWSLIDADNNSFINTGVRIFPKGVKEEKGNESSKNEDRRKARGIRRQYFRRRLRKKFLLRFLVEYNLTPISTSNIEYWVKYGKFPDTPEIREWFNMDPYQLRSKAIEDKLTDSELGRVLYHLGKRRGFLSNRKSATKEDGAIFKGDPNSGKTGILETREELDNHKTLGSYLASINPHTKRIRNRYTTRRMYVEEFHEIWDKQARLNPNLTDEMKAVLCNGTFNETQLPTEGILFHQRPLRSQKHLIGKCSLIPSKPRALLAALEVEEFNMWKILNTIAYKDTYLSHEHKELAWNYVISQKNIVDFKKLKKFIGYDGVQLNYLDDAKLPSVSSHYHLQAIFGKEFWSLSDKEKNDRWHLLQSSDNADWLNAYAQEKWKLTNKQLDNLKKAHFKDGYSAYSLKAIKLMLPFVRAGFNEYLAKLFAGVVHAFGEEWNLIDDEEKQTILDTIENFSTGLEGSVIKQVRNFLKEEYDLTDKQLSKLFFNKDVRSEREILNRFPEITENLRNPIVQTALTELRKLINDLIDEYGSLHTIRIEMARDLKNSAKKRDEIKIKQAKQQKENERAKVLLEELNINPSRINLLKMKLYEELKKKICPFTGKTISLSKDEGGTNLGLFSNRVQVEHIYPWSRTLNDSFSNKTLCEASTNQDKGSRTPFEYFSGQSEEEWLKVKERAYQVLPYNKYKHFIRKEIPKDFISQQLNDTRYISKVALDKLKDIAPNVNINTGRLTAHLRHLWGLNSILNPAKDSKTRDDHRHHAIDAIVVAFSTTSYLQQMSQLSKYSHHNSAPNIELPWDTFRGDVEEQIENILVSHKRNSKVLSKKITRVKKEHLVNGKKRKVEYTYKGGGPRGQLHNESIYGKRKNPLTGKEAFHIRKPLADINSKTKVDKIVDPAIRNLVLNHLKNHGIDTSKKKFNFDSSIFFKVNDDNTKESILLLPNKNGAKIPIKKIRVAENIGNAETIDKDQTKWVDPRNNHHIALYKDDNDNYYEEVVTFWVASQRALQGEPIIKKHHENGAILVTALEVNKTYLLGLNIKDKDDLNHFSNREISQSLYRVQKLSSMYFVFRLVSESTITNDCEPYFKRLVSFKSWLINNPIEVKVSRIGKIQWLGL